MLDTHSLVNPWLEFLSETQWRSLQKTAIALSSLRQQVGVVDQDTFLFGSTIRENISLGHPDRPLENVVEAAKLAGIHEFIQSLPMGYETQIGEGGRLLSGGQRQRIAIARSLMGEPRLSNKTKLIT